jgi:fermentation-respiration switch protein FrsA (DUF1100 family)
MPFMHLISPKPLLMVLGDDDTITPLPGQLDAYGAAREPKSLVILPGEHEQIYESPLKERALEEAVRWLKATL